MKTNRMETFPKATRSVINSTLCAALLLIGAGTSVQAQTQQAKATPVAQVSSPAVIQPSRTEINLGGVVIMRLIGEYGLTAEQRTNIILERLIPILALDDLQAADVVLRAGPDMSYTSIYVRDHLLVTVTKALARANNTTPEALAAIYAERFRRVLPQVGGGEYNQYTDLAGRGRL
jgi:hypothetical protein